MITSETPELLDFPHITESEQSNFSGLDHAAPSEVDPGRAERERADVFARSVGSASLDTLRDHHVALAMAVIELAHDAGRPLPWSTDDATVALLRAAAKLAIDTPHATSAAAADLVGRLARSAKG